MSEVLIYGHGSNSISDSNNGRFIRYVKDIREFKRRVLTEDFSIIIIDLEKREQHGIDAAEYARQIPRQCLTPIVFLYINEKYEAEAFHRIHCYDYLIKPIDANSMFKLISICMQRMSVTSDDDTIVFHIGAKRYPVSKDDIYFIEISGRNATVHTKNKELKVPYLVLDDFLGQYGTMFVKIHRAIAVNRKYITKLNISEQTIELEDGHLLGVGRRYMVGLRKEFDEVAYKRYTRKKDNR